MRIGLRLLRPESVEWLRRELRRGSLSRAALGRGLCERDDWRNPRGELCAASARKALPHLAGRLGLALPPAQSGPPRSCEAAGDVSGLAQTAFSGSLADLGEVRLVLSDYGVGAAAVRASAGVGPSAGSGSGAGLPVDVFVGGGGGSCGGAELRGGAAAVGSSRRASGLGRPHAWGSHRAGGLERPFSVVGLGCGFRTWRRTYWGVQRRVWRSDWEARHGVRPVLLETCVEASRPATSYRAAGWKCVGRTAGRPPGSPAATEPKNVLLLGLESGAGRRRCGVRRRGRRGRIRRWRWRTMRVGRGGSLGARTWRTGGCGGVWSGWGRGGRSIRVSRCLRSSPAAPNSRRRTVSCTIGR